MAITVTLIMSIITLLVSAQMSMADTVGDFSEGNGYQFPDQTAAFYDIYDMDSGNDIEVDVDIPTDRGGEALIGIYDMDMGESDPVPQSKMSFSDTVQSVEQQQIPPNVDFENDGIYNFE